MTRLSRLALDWIVEKSDPLHPQLFDLQDEYKKLLVDNPDVHYTFCVLDDTRSYRLVGYRGECAYLGMTFGTAVRAGAGRGPHRDADADPHRRVRARSRTARSTSSSRRPPPCPTPGRATRSSSSRARRSWPSGRRTSRSARTRFVPPAGGAGARTGRGRAAAHPLDRGARAQARVRRHVPHLRGRDGAADVARRGHQHEHVRRPGRLGPRRVAGGRGALALQRGDDVPRRALPARARARRSWSPCTSPTSPSSTGG